MLRDTAIQLVCQRLGGHRTDLIDRAREEMELVQTELEGGAFMPWFLEQVDTINIAAGATFAMLPPRFLREMGDDNDGGLAYVTDEGRLSFLTRVGNRKASLEIGQLDSASARGAPQAYSLGSTRLNIFPVADKAYTLQYTYWGRDDEQNVNTENGWLLHAPDVLIARTCQLLAEHIVSLETNVGAFERDYGRAMQRLLVAHEARMNEGRHRELGEQ